MLIALPCVSIASAVSTDVAPAGTSGGSALMASTRSPVMYEAGSSLLEQPLASASPLETTSSSDESRRIRNPPAARARERTASR